MRLHCKSPTWVNSTQVEPAFTLGNFFCSVDRALVNFLKFFRGGQSFLKLHVKTKNSISAERENIIGRVSTTAGRASTSLALHVSPTDQNWLGHF